MLNYFLDYNFILYVFLGSFLGLIIGAMPGLSVSMATALLVSITYSWETSNALATIMGIYVVGVFSGAISAILLNIPGAPSSVVTAIDGHPMVKNGEGYKALVYASVYSFIGSMIGIIMLYILSKPVSAIALKFKPQDYFLLAILGIITVSGLSSKNKYKAYTSTSLGLLLSLIGMDTIMGTDRLTFGSSYLKNGLPLVAILIGLFGISEVFLMIKNYRVNSRYHIKEIDMEKISWKELLSHFPNSIYYGVLGGFIGALPGAGGPVAAFLAYNQAEKIEKNPSKAFGKGAVEGIIASETANNAVVGGALIPMLTMGIPGDSVTAIILSVFYLHGLNPGPKFLLTNPNEFNAIIAAGILASIFLLLMGLYLSPKIIKIINIPQTILIIVILVLSVLGAYASNNMTEDIWIAIIFGIIGYMMKKNDYPVGPLTLAFILGKMMDSNFRRTISLLSSSDHKLLYLFSSKITLLLLFLILISIFRQNKKAI